MNDKININAKNVLARLLASENLSVIHSPNAQTASFNLLTRVVELPMLKDMNSQAYTAFIAHEISHALWTPAQAYMDAGKNDVPPSYINITEDARIEKLLKRKFPGTKALMFHFYKDLADKDFFGLSAKPDLSVLPLIDKINLHFKIGHAIQIPFTSEEQLLVTMVDNEESFEDARKAAIAIYEHDKNNDNTPEDKEAGEGDSSGGGECGGFTQEAFDKAFSEKQVSETGEGEVVDLSEECEDYNESVDDIDDAIQKIYSINQRGARSTHLTNFLSELRPTIATMVNRFNMRKSASDYQKIKVSNSGQIDSKKLARYRTHDNIFLKNESVPEGKNHGLVIMVDWSSSMASQLDSTIKQAVALIEFCRKIQIPYVVYGFTSKAYNLHKVIPEKTPRIKNEGMIFEIFNSSMKNKDYTDYLHGFYMSMKAHKRVFSMGMTPTCHCSLLINKKIQSFKSAHQIEKLSMIVITDGGATDNINVGKGSFLISKKRLMNYKLDTSNNNWTSHTIFKYIKDVNNLHSLTGIFVTEGYYKSFERTLGWLGPDTTSEEHYTKYTDCELAFKKHNFTAYTDTYAFDKYFVVDVNSFKLKGIKNSRKSLIFMNIFVDLIS